MSAIDIYRLIDSIGEIGEKEDIIQITGSKFFALSLEFEELGVDYEFSQYSLNRFESQFKDNVKLGRNEVIIKFSDEFRRTLKVLNQNVNYMVPESEIQKIWEKISK